MAMAVDNRQSQLNGMSYDPLRYPQPHFTNPWVSGPGPSPERSRAAAKRRALNRSPKDASRSTNSAAADADNLCLRGETSWSRSRPSELSSRACRPRRRPRLRALPTRDHAIDARNARGGGAQALGTDGGGPTRRPRANRGGQWAGRGRPLASHRLRGATGFGRSVSRLGRMGRCG